MTDTPESSERQNPLGRLLEGASDFIGKLWEKLPYVVGIGAIFYGQNRPAGVGDPWRRSTDEFLNWFVGLAEEVQYGILRDWRRLRLSLVWLGIGTILCGISSLLVCLLNDSRQEKMVWLVSIAAVVALAYTFVYFANYRAILKAAAIGGGVISGKRIMVHLKAIEDAARDFGKGGAQDLDGLLGSVKDSFKQCGIALQDGLDTFRKIGITTFQRPQRIVAWYAASSAYLLLVNLTNPILWGVGVLGLLTLLPGVLAWEEERPVVPRRLLRIAAWAILIPVAGLALVPDFARLLFTVQDFIRNVPEEVVPRLLIHNQMHLWAWIAVMSVWTMFELCIFPTVVGAESFKRWLREAGIVCLTLIVTSFFILGVLVQMYDLMAMLYEAGKWRQLGYLVVAIAAVVSVAKFGSRGKLGHAALSVLGLIGLALAFEAGNAIYRHGHPRSSEWGGRFHYGPPPTGGTTVPAPKVPKPQASYNSLMLSTSGDVQPGLPKATTSAPTTSQSSLAPWVPQVPRVAEAVPPPPAPVQALPDTAWQVLGCNSAPWKLYMKPGRYLLSYYGTLNFVDVPPVVEYKDGQRIQHSVIVNEQGGTAPVDLCRTPERFPLGYGSKVGELYFEMNGGERYALAKVKGKVLETWTEGWATLGLNLTNEPFWKGNGSITVQIVQLQ